MSGTSMYLASVEKFRIAVPGSDIQRLNDKLDSITYPDELDDAGWELGSPLTDVRRLAQYWRHQFDWREAEKKLNQLPHFTVQIQCDGYESLQIHFVHQRSHVQGSIPLLFVHGWPGSFLEVTKILPQLAAGDDGEVAFDVIAPSLPNYGFSEGTRKRGFSIDQYAETCHKLMLCLGYDQYVTQGGDWGYAITRAVSIMYPEHCKASHFNMDVGSPPTFRKHPLLALEAILKIPTKREQQGVARSQWFETEGYGYNLLQSTKPQTLGYALSDSPFALLSWIYEKLHDWTDSYAWTDEEVCTWISIYYFSTAGPAASLRIYYEIGRSGPWGSRLTPDQLRQWLPTARIGLSHFPRDIFVLPSTSTRTQGPCVFEKEHSSGGHFAAWEKPAELVADVREMFGRGGGAYGVIRGRSGY